MRHLLLALQFLTVLPVRVRGPVSEEDMIRSVPYFVFVGLIQGSILLFVLRLSEEAFHYELSIFIVLVTYILLNGGFHIDGLSDTFDALRVKSSGDREIDINKRLQVAKDSFSGPIGVTAIVSVIGLKYLSLKNISHLIPFTYYSSLVLMPVFSKWVMISAMTFGRPAKKDGLGQVFLGRISGKGFLLSFFFLALIYGMIYLLTVVGDVTGILASALSLSTAYSLFYGLVTLLGYLLAIVWILFCNRRFGGLTGDTLGALSEISEVIFLMMVILWSRLYIS